MKAKTIKSILGFALLCVSLGTSAQCDILNRVAPDGSMQYYMEPVNFYWTKAKSLTGCIVTDKENYFLELHPLPFPDKHSGKKLKNDLTITLADGNSYELRHFDTRYVENDTVMEMLFLIGKDDLDNLQSSEVSGVMIDMKDEEGPRSYQFVLHKAALKEQLACFLNDEKDKKNK